MELFEKKEIMQIIKYMSVLASALCGIRVRVIEISGDDIGYSQRKGNSALVAINFQTDLVPTKREREIFVYGVFAHELMHIIRTDFDYDMKMMSFYPARERYYRHNMMNIIEDPAIEFFAGDHLSDFLNKCLQYSIAVIYQSSPRLEESMTPYTQFLNALIQFGDLGFTIGEFSFPEAEEAFRKVIRDVNDAIEEPLFKKRFNTSMDVFNKTRDLLEKDLEEQKEFEKFLQELLKQYGKGAPPEGDGEPISTDRPHNGSGDSEDDPNNGASARRKKTIVILTEEPEESSGSGNASEDKEKSSEAGDVSNSKENSSAQSDSSAEEPDDTEEDSGSGRADDSDDETTEEDFKSGHTDSSDDEAEGESPSEDLDKSGSQKDQESSAKDNNGSLSKASIGDSEDADETMPLEAEDGADSKHLMMHPGSPTQKDPEKLLWKVTALPLLPQIPANPQKHQHPHLVTEVRNTCQTT